jgi:dienelactone hydrolase
VTHRLLLAALLGLPACAPSGPEALMTAPDVRTTPWPSDALLGSDGRVQVALPLPFDSANLDNLQQLARTLSEHDGFGVSTSIFFPVSEAVIVEAGATAAVIDLEDPAVPARAYPLFYRKDTKQLVAMTPVGAVLKEHHQYGCLIESGVNLRPSAGMADAIAGRGEHGARPSYQKLAAAIATRGTTPLAATAFTTQTLSAQLPKILSDLAKMPPKATVTRFYKDAAELETLFGGAVTTTRPGEPRSGGVLHDQIGFVAMGTFESPHYLDATPGQLGLFDTQATVKAVDHIPYVLVLPKRADYASTPVVIFQHGINDDRHSVFKVANSFAAKGYAVMGIDELWHGSRLPGSEDKLNNFSREPIPDGIGDPTGAGAVQWFFNIRGDTNRRIEALDPRYMRDNFRQAVVDLMQEVRLAKSGDLSAIAAADPALATLSLDGSKLIYTGESFGSILGAQVLALDPELGAGAFSVGGGGLLVDLVPNSAEFAQSLQPFVAGAFDLSFDVNSPEEQPNHAQMVLALLQTVIEPGDGLALAGLADPGKHYLALTARDDETVPNISNEAVAAAWGATQVRLSSKTLPTRKVTFPMASAPYSAPAGGLRAIVQLDPSTHSQITHQSGQQKYEPDAPPFRKRATAVPIENPIEIVHALAVGLADSYRAGMPVVIDAK